MAAEFVETLAEMRTALADPSRPVRDPASLVTARELIDATLARVSGKGTRRRDELAANVNLSYATMVAVIDLVKSHTDGPRIPVRGTARGAPLLGPANRRTRSSRAG